MWLLQIHPNSAARASGHARARSCGPRPLERCRSGGQKNSTYQGWGLDFGQGWQMREAGLKESVLSETGHWAGANAPVQFGDPFPWRPHSPLPPPHINSAWPGKAPEPAWPPLSQNLRVSGALAPTPRTPGGGEGASPLSGPGKDNRLVGAVAGGQAEQPGKSARRAGVCRPQPNPAPPLPCRKPLAK
jgi:hypothetical protein